MDAEVMNPDVELYVRRARKAAKAREDYRSAPIGSRQELEALKVLGDSEDLAEIAEVAIPAMAKMIEEREAEVERMKRENDILRQMHQGMAWDLSRAARTMEEEVPGKLAKTIREIRENAAFSERLAASDDPPNEISREILELNRKFAAVVAELAEARAALGRGP